MCAVYFSTIRKKNFIANLFGDDVTSEVNVRTADDDIPFSKILRQRIEEMRIHTFEYIDYINPVPA